MAAYYNEIDPYAAQWLRNLIANKLIADGDVDERSIRDVAAADLHGYTQCHFFAGIAGWSHALRLAGWPDDRPVWTGSCPCQPFSAAGKGKGFEDDRHLWPAFHMLINECRPPVVFGEQVASKDGLGWLDTVHTDMEASGYAFGAADLCAAGIGAPHIRQRLFWVASDPDRVGGARLRQATSVGASRPWGAFGEMDLCQILESPFDLGNGFPQPLIRSLDNGVFGRVGRLRAYGNAIVPQAAAEMIGAYLDAAEDVYRQPIADRGDAIQNRRA